MHPFQKFRSRAIERSFVIIRTLWVVSLYYLLLYKLKTIHILKPKNLVRKQGEATADFNNRMAETTLKFFVRAQILLALATGVRMGIYTVTLREQYGDAIFQLQPWYFVTATLCNIAMGIMADSVLGRKRILIIGTLSIVLSYECHSHGTWNLAVLGEVCYGFGEACLTGILSAWLRNTLEHYVGTDYREYYQRAVEKSFGWRYASITTMALIAGNLLPYCGIALTWRIGAITSALYFLIIVYRMWWRKIYTPRRPRKSFWRTLQKSITEVSTNEVLKRYFIFGSIQNAVWALLGISWYYSFANVIPAQFLILVGGIATAFGSIGSYITYRIEQKPRYKNLPNDEKDEEDFRWMRFSHLVGGGIIVVSAAMGGVAGILLYLFANIFRGVFQKKFAGSITSAISSDNRNYATTIISWFETFGSLSKLGVTWVGGRVEKFSPDGSTLNFFLSGFAMILSGSALGMETLRQIRDNVHARVRNSKTLKKVLRRKGGDPERGKDLPRD